LGLFEEEQALGSKIRRVMKNIVETVGNMLRQLLFGAS
jgi:hypothetical protein